MQDQTSAAAAVMSGVVGGGGGGGGVSGASTITSMQDVKMETMEQGHPLHHQQHQVLQSQNSLLMPKVEVKLEDELHQQMLQQQQQQQQQQLQAHLSLLNQQRLLKHHHQQLLQSLPQSQAHLQQRQHHIQHLQQQQQQLQHLQHQQHQNFVANASSNSVAHHTQPQHQQHLLALPPKQVHEPGSCSRRVMQYIYHQRHRPQDNSITFWRRFIAEYFAPRAKKRWCVSLYGNGNNGRQPTGVFPQDVWQCEICGTKPGRGFETTVEVLPRLCKIKYDSGIIEELLFVDMPHEYRLASGVIVLEYGKAIQESIFDQLRVVRDGQLRIIFAPDLKILSWEFCARSHEELLPRRMIVPQVTQLATVAQKYQQSVSQTGAAGLSSQDLQTNCNMFVSSSRNLARNLEVPTVNDLGYTKRYVRCLQISEVVNSMKDLIDFSRENAMGPKASLEIFPRRTGLGGGPSTATANGIPQQSPLLLQQQQQQQEQQVSSMSGIIEESDHHHHQLVSSSTIAPVRQHLPHQHQNQNQQHYQLQHQQQQLGSSLQGLLGTFPSLTQQQPQQSSTGTISPASSLIISKNTTFQAAQILTGNSSNLQSPTSSGNLMTSPPAMINSSNSASMLQHSSNNHQQQQQDSVVHQLLQEMMMNAGSSGMISPGNSLSHGVGNGNGFGNNHSVLETSSNLGNIRNIGGSSSERLAAAPQQQQQQQKSLYMSSLQDGGGGVRELAENGILSGLGSVNGFGSLPFDWKSP